MISRSLTPSLKAGLIWSVTAFLLAGCERSTLPSEPAVVSRPNAAVIMNEHRSLDTVITNNCTGEDLALSGTVHTLFSITESRNGGFHLQFHMNQEFSGTGLTTGMSYRSIGVDNFSLNTSGLPFEQTSVGNARLLGRGAGGDLMVHYLQHLTVDANGNLRVLNDDFRFECT